MTFGCGGRGVRRRVALGRWDRELYGLNLGVVSGGHIVVGGSWAGGMIWGRSVDMTLDGEEIAKDSDSS